MFESRVPRAAFTALVLALGLTLGLALATGPAAAGHCDDLQTKRAAAADAADKATRELAEIKRKVDAGKLDADALYAGLEAVDKALETYDALSAEYAAHCRG